MLTNIGLTATVDTIAAVQTRSGLIPRTAGGQADPWTHVEAAMALTAGGRIREAHRAFEWLVATQRRDGAWHQYYRASGAVDVPLLDANFVAYVATGTWHHFMATGDTGFLGSMWPVVDRALAFVVRLQTPGGEILWARHADGRPWPFALLTASSCCHLSLRCGLAIAARFGHERPSWESAAARVAEAIELRPGSFAPKDRWAMDWYYPVLSGVVTGEGAGRRLDRGWDRFVVEGRGVRCVSDHWITAAETCEAALAFLAAGRDEEARRLFDWAQHLRAPDGSYYTGIVHPAEVSFPRGERSTYSAAAAVLAADALCNRAGPTAALFCPSPVRGEPLRT